MARVSPYQQFSPNYHPKGTCITTTTTARLADASKSGIEAGNGREAALQRQHQARLIQGTMRSFNCNDRR
jgi:hypothetical protein